MKTPMQEHIAYLNGLHEIIVAYYGSKSVKKIQLDILSLCISNAKAMLEKEKDVMCDFAKCCTSNGSMHEIDYIYDELFNTKEK